MTWANHTDTTKNKYKSITLINVGWRRRHCSNCYALHPSLFLQLCIICSYRGRSSTWSTVAPFVLSYKDIFSPGCLCLAAVASFSELLCRVSRCFSEGFFFLHNCAQLVNSSSLDESQRAHRKNDLLSAFLSRARAQRSKIMWASGEESLVYQGNEMELFFLFCFILIYNIFSCGFDVKFMCDTRFCIFKIHM